MEPDLLTAGKTVLIKKNSKNKGQDVNLTSEAEMQPGSFSIHSVPLLQNTKLWIEFGELLNLGGK
jgi:hypothetical protein